MNWPVASWKAEEMRPEFLHGLGWLETWRLAKGLRVIVHSDHYMPLVHIHLCCLGGSRHEVKERSGLAHLCEHLAFTGARNGGESYPELINRVGGTTQGLTFHDRTSFGDTLPSHQLPLGLWLAAQRLAGPASGDTLQGLEVQRRILLEERLLRRERLFHAEAFEILYRLLYPDDHPYHRPPAGSPEGIRAITGEDIIRYFGEHYTPENALLVLVGDVSTKDAAAAVAREFDSLSSGPGVRPRFPRTGEMPLPEGDRHLVVPDRTSQGRTYVAYRFPGYGSRAWYAAAMLVRALAVGRCSPLVRDLVDRQGIAQDVRVCVDSMRDATTATFIATGAPGISAAALESVLLEALERHIAAGISERELEHGRKRALIDHYTELQSLHRRAAAIACWAAFVKMPTQLEELAETYRALDAEEVNSLARRFCRTDQCAVLSLLSTGDSA